MTDYDPPAPAPGLTLDALHEQAQDVEHCGEPMRYVHNRTGWTGHQGSGTEERLTLRACVPCGATLTITTTTPS